MWTSFDHNIRVPENLRHRLVTTDSSIEGASVSTHRTQLRVLAPPLQGAGWRPNDQAAHTEQTTAHKKETITGLSSTRRS